MVEGLGFSIPAGTAQVVAEQLIQDGAVARPYLGIRYQSIDPQIATVYRLPAQWGVYVTQVDAGSPAANAGIQEEDIIVQVGDVALDGDHPYVNALFEYKPGDKVTLALYRAATASRWRSPWKVRNNNLLSRRKLAALRSLPREKAMAVTLQVQFECHTLPHSASPLPLCQRLGIQEGKEVIQDVPFEGQPEIRFQFSLQAEEEPVSGTVIFKGKYVQGPRSDPFIYLCWGERSEGTWVTCGRAKIPLGAIPRQQIQRALHDGVALRARIRMSDSRGNPAFATLKANHVEWIE